MTESGTPPAASSRPAAGRSVLIHPDAAQVLGIDAGGLPELVEEAIREHDRLIGAAGPAVLKNAPESAVTRVETAGFPAVCVKEFRSRGLLHAFKGLLRPTQGLRTFRNGWALIAAGFNTAAPLALVREKRGGLVRREWIIMEIIPDALEMDRFILSRIAAGRSASEKRELTRHFGRFIGSLHARGILHSDLKTCNILVSEERTGTVVPSTSESLPAATPSQTFRFSLLDYDDVRFESAPTRTQRVKNLTQIFLSTPRAITATDRIRFLAEYALHAGLTRKERYELAARVLEKARGREILYVGFDGDIIERWE